MLSASIATLRERKRSLAAESAALTSDAKRQRRRLRMSAAAAARQWVLDEGLRRRVLLIYTLADCTPEPAALYLTAAAAERHWPPRDNADIVRTIEDAFLAADVDEIASLSDVAHPLDAAALRPAIACVEQWRLRSWVEVQNRRGVNPDTRLVLEEFEQMRAALPADLRPGLWLGTPGARVRATRWRRRLGGRFAPLRPRDVVPLPELRARVCGLAVPWDWHAIMSCGSEFGTDFLARIWPRILCHFLAMLKESINIVTNCCRNLGPESGQKSCPFLGRRFGAI
jgi:hypothetical protein